LMLAHVESSNAGGTSLAGAERRYNISIYYLTGQVGMCSISAIAFCTNATTSYFSFEQVTKTNNAAFLPIQSYGTFLLYHAFLAEYSDDDRLIACSFLPVATCNGNFDIMVGSTLIGRRNRELGDAMSVACSSFSKSSSRVTQIMGPLIYCPPLETGAAPVRL
jgi:hypothetical protein